MSTFGLLYLREDQDKLFILFRYHHFTSKISIRYWRNGIWNLEIWNILISDIENWLFYDSLSMFYSVWVVGMLVLSMFLIFQIMIWYTVFCQCSRYSRLWFIMLYVLSMFLIFQIMIWYTVFCQCSRYSRLWFIMLYVLSMFNIPEKMFLLLEKHQIPDSRFFSRLFSEFFPDFIFPFHPMHAYAKKKPVWHFST